MHDLITIETDLFEHREVKPHFINPCCFGEDFAAWLLRELAPLAADGFVVGDPVQEDYGWGFWVRHQRCRFWVALSYVGNGPQENPAQWMVSVNPGAGLRLLGRLFRNSCDVTFAVLRDRIWRSLRQHAEIRTPPSA